MLFCAVRPAIPLRLVLICTFVQNYNRTSRIILRTYLVDNFIIIFYFYLSLTFSMIFVRGCSVLSPLHFLSSSVDPPICLRIITIGCPLLVHRMSIETMDIRWRFDGDAMDILRSHNGESTESERTHIGESSDSKRRSDVKSTHHHRMILGIVMSLVCVARVFIWVM